MLHSVDLEENIPPQWPFQLRKTTLKAEASPRCASHELNQAPEHSRTLALVSHILPILALRTCGKVIGMRKVSTGLLFLVVAPCQMPQLISSLSLYLMPAGLFLT